MGKNSKISWTHHTFNPWWGCVKVSPGCKNCYADTFDRRTGGNHWGKEARRRFMSDKRWKEPLKWNAEAVRRGERHRVFCASMADVFELLDAGHPDADAQDTARERLWALIEETPQLDWLLLTKRPENIRLLLPDRWIVSWPQENVWLGVTTENQEQADKRIPILCQAPAVVRFLSYEPALAPIRPDLSLIDWVIAGAESGQRRRPMSEDWVRSIRDQCIAQGVPFFYKQKMVDSMKVETPKLDGRQWIQFPN